jgi:mono/diheme cytochrome c family protein
MKIVVPAMVLAVSLLSAAAAFAQGNAEAGKKLWTAGIPQCRNCHGLEGQGGFGPDLAGRGLSIEQFRQAIRTPWGIMPAYPAQLISDMDVADFVAYFNSLPRVATPGPWRTAVPAGASLGQQLSIATVGCGQCHGASFADGRDDMGAAGADFEWFRNMVYNHVAAAPDERRAVGEDPDRPIRMGDFSRLRLPEPMLQEIWKFISVEQGLIVPVEARLAPGLRTGGAANAPMVYMLSVENTGAKDKGLVAEDVTISLSLPAGSRVVNTSGPGYQGVQKDGQGEVAVWKLPRMAPKDMHTYAVAVTHPAGEAQRLHGLIRWSKPVMGDGKGGSVTINPPPAASGAPARQ